MSEQIKLVLSDVDGTQIIHGRKRPTLAVRRAAWALRKRDVYLAEATSRTHAMVQRLVRPLSLQENLCVLDGGATVARAASGEVVWSHWLSAASVHAVVRAIGPYCTRIHFDSASRRRSRDEVLAALEYEVVVDGKPSIFAVFPVEDGEKIVQLLEDIPGVGHSRIMHYNTSETHRCIQICNPGINKRSGMEQVVNLAGLRGTQKLATGDGFNDLDLFEGVAEDGGLIALMGNAPLELKAIVKKRWPDQYWIAPSVEEDGFAVAMKHFGLA